MATTSAEHAPGKPSQWVLPVTLAAALVLHFTIVASYANPLRKSTEQPPYRVQWYVYPFFHQTWNLFVPPPRHNYRLFYACASPGGVRKGELLSELRNEIRSNVFSGYGGIRTAFTNGIYYFDLAAAEKKTLSHVGSGPQFDMISKAAASFLAWRDSCGPPRLILQVIDAQGRSRVYAKR